MQEFDHAEWQRKEKEFAKYFVKESWALYGLAIAIIVLRFISRIRRCGFNGLKIDEALMVFGTVTYTFMIFGISFVLQRGAESNYMPVQAAIFLSPSEKMKIIVNEKWIFAIEHFLMATLWSTKFAMLAIYLRITDRLQTRKFIWGLVVYVGLAFVGAEFLLLFTCRPVSRRWTIPSQDTNCSFYTHYQIGEGVFSLSSTVFILIIGLPIVIRVRLPPRQKWIVTILFGLGLFDVAAGALTKVYVVNISLYGFMYFAWYVREATVALLVCNLPFAWSLISDLFPSVKEWSSRNDINSTPRFWQERKRKGSYFCCVGSRKNSAAPGVPSFVMERNTNSLDMKHVEHNQGAGVFEDHPVQHRLSGKMEAAVIGRMTGGQLEDDIDLDFLTDRKIFVDIERAVSAARSKLFSPGVHKDELWIDTTQSPTLSANNEGKIDVMEHFKCCDEHTTGMQRD